MVTGICVTLIVLGVILLMAIVIWAIKMVKLNRPVYRRKENSV